MWYEIIPGVAVMTVALIIPGITTTYVQRFCNGGKEKRVARNQWQWYLMQRDKQLSGTGKHFDSKGLENIH